MTIPTPRRFDLAVDQAARHWLQEHPTASRLFIAFSSTSCCFGARVCDVRIRVEAGAGHRKTGAAGWLPIGELEGREVLLDTRICNRLPRAIPLTARGVGRFRHLELDLDGAQWATVLYPVAR